MPKSSVSLSRRLVSINQAAEYANVNPRTIRRRISDGSLTGYRLGKRLIRVDLNELTRPCDPSPAQVRHERAA